MELDALDEFNNRADEILHYIWDPIGGSAVGGMQSAYRRIPPKVPPDLLRWKNTAQQTQLPGAASFLLFRSKSNPGPVFGFELTNEDSVAYASIA